jgi:cyclohexa-1,5-dienecarbonyl-CoA hydratase
LSGLSGLNGLSDLVRVTPQEDPAFWRVTFGAGRGNIIDRATMAALGKVFADASGTSGLKAIYLEGAGEDFSFGASIQEHQVDQVAAMLAEFRQLILALLESRVIVIAAVRGRCLGGGLELASVCHRIVATADATFGQPEIALGVFAPVASIVLPERVGRPRAEDLCLTGRTLSAAEAHGIGLIDQVTPQDPALEALAWARTHLAPLSASSLRIAVGAIRADFTERIRTRLPELETLYTSELMATKDANEGLNAFLEKRRPVWSDR